MHIHLYDLWQSIQYLWSVGGPVEQRKWPKDIPKDLYKHHLTQKTISELCNLLEGFLVDIQFDYKNFNIEQWGK